MIFSRVIRARRSLSSQRPVTHERLAICGFLVCSPGSELALRYMEGSISADELALWPHAADLAWAHNFQTKFLGAEPRYCARRDQRRDTRGRPRARERARVSVSRAAPLYLRAKRAAVQLPESPREPARRVPRQEPPRVRRRARARSPRDPNSQKI